MTEPRGTIHLITRAPISADYQHTIDFKNPTEQRAFWGSLVKSSLSQDKYSYIRRDRRYIQVGKPFEELEGVNYMMFQSREGSKWYYAFVLDVVYVNDNLTQVYFELDVMQSFMFDYEVKPSYIAQSHVDRWDANHKPKYSRTDEGLDYGSEYVTESAFKVEKDIGETNGFYFVFCKEHPVESGTAGECTKVRGTPIPYVIYLIPNQDSETEPLNALQHIMTFNKTDGETTPAFEFATMHAFQDFMMSSDFGNYVHQIVFVPYLPFEYDSMTDGSGYWATTINASGAGTANNNGVFDFGRTVLSSDGKTCALLKIREIHVDNLMQVLAKMPVLKGIKEIPDDAMWTAIKAKPLTTERDRRFESKLLCYPYRYNIFTDWTTPPALIKNEYLTGDEITLKCSMGFGFNMPRRYWLDGYRKDPEGRESSIMQAIPLEQPIISDAYYTYMLQNKNQIAANVANARDSAAIADAQTTFNAAMGVAGGLTSSVVAGAAGNVGGVANGLTGALSAGVNAGYSIAGRAQNITNMIRSENAKQSDIRKLPDTYSNTNDCSFAISDKSKFITFYRKKICCEFAEQLAQYWHMFGYVVKRVEVPNTRSRKRYNYIKTVGANVIGDIEQVYLQQIRAIYDNGVTFWHYSATDFNPMDYTFENIEVSLL